MSQDPSGPLSQSKITACSGRLERLRRRLPDLGVDAMLVNGETDILYLTSFVGHDSLLLLSADGAWIISDSRYDEFLDPWRESGMAAVEMGIRHRLHETLGTLCVAHGLKRIGLQSDAMTLARRNQFGEALTSLTLVDTVGVLATQRMRKDADEIEEIERAIRAHHDGLRAALEHLRLGMTEMDFSARLEFEMKRCGAFKASFDQIVGTGANGSVMHYMTARDPIGPGLLLVDAGAQMPSGYCSDITRTFVVGETDEQFTRIYNVVLAAQLAAIEAIRPGKTCAEIDAVARAVITEAGYGPEFGHGLGHGMGIDVHEPPYFNDLQTDVILEPGMVMTVEPGVYIPGRGGVRIEDDIVVTTEGCRVLSDFPKAFEDMVVNPTGSMAMES